LRTLKNPTHVHFAQVLGSVDELKGAEQVEKTDADRQTKRHPKTGQFPAKRQRQATRTDHTFQQTHQRLVRADHFVAGAQLAVGTIIGW